MKFTRRNFVKTAGLGSIAVSGVLNGMSMPASTPQTTKSGEQKQKVFLFQGDSITDGNRTRDNDWNHVLGHGYAYLIASRLWYNNTDKNLMFYNRGISGNRVKDLEARWQEDTLNLKPDVLSILAGVNDVIAIIEGWAPDTLEQFETSYRNLIEKTQSKLPETMIVLCEPFSLPLGWVNKKPDIWQTEIEKRQKLIDKLAGEYNTLYVALQKPFDDACQKAPKEYWIWDGVHPMPAGHELIARCWIDEIHKKMPELVF